MKKTRERERERAKRDEEGLSTQEAYCING